MDDGETFELLSLALDEIYRLREALAYEAGGIVAHAEYKTFPKSRRIVAAEQIMRMRQAARGEARVAYAGESSAHLRGALRSAGAGETFTMNDWRNECRIDEKRTRA